MAWFPDTTEVERAPEIAPPLTPALPAEWRAEEVAQLLALRADGLTCVQVAERMGKTKGMIVGKLNRLRGYHHPRARSSTVEPAAHNGEVIGSTPAGHTIHAPVALPPPDPPPDAEAPPAASMPAAIQRYVAPSGMHRIINVDDISGAEYVAGCYSASSRDAMYHMQRGKPKGTTSHVYDDEGFWIASCGDGPSRSHQMRPR